MRNNKILFPDLNTITVGSLALEFQKALFAAYSK